MTPFEPTYVVRATIVARTSQVLWGETEDGAIVAIHDSSVESFPFSHIVPGPLPAGDVGAAVALGRARPERGAPTLAIAPVDDVGPAHVLEAVDVSGFEQPVRLGGALTAGLNESDAALADAVANLVGRGEGLTPAGDDVLLGALAAEAAFADPWGLARRIALAVDRLPLESLTTRPSVALLRGALDGHYPPALSNLFGAMGDPRRIGAAVTRVRNIGHSSGASMLCGIAAVAHHTISSSIERKHGLHHATRRLPDRIL